ncbi:hypothetical protein G7Y89_g6456 [Cudoniella acicularis]|uniref:Uncharacterized protein n=1 Tax=Cudoniella acicularis TaxID=354080 RepID=A0A8H4RMN0_9HELO|nr:hypothetical protein G7Y89_g6456 [Cudoniella acicularis]
MLFSIPRAQNVNLLRLFAIFHLLSFVTAVLPYINTTLSSDDENCRFCPYEACASYDIYIEKQTHTFSCWTHGEKFAANDSDNIWLRSENNCYIPQYQLKYNGTAQEDLAYCGASSEEKIFNTQNATVQWDTECNSVPWFLDIVNEVRTVQKYKPGVEVTLTCWYASTESTALGDSIFTYTTDKCYISETGLYEKADQTLLPNCEHNAKAPPPQRRYPHVVETLSTKKPRHARPAVEKQDFLFEVQMTSDAPCREHPTNTSAIVTTYRDGTNATVQCFTAPPGRGGPLLWMETTDWCYITELDTAAELREIAPGEPYCADYGGD